MNIHKIEAGHFNADGGACFGVVPKRVWKKRYPCDEDNFCKLTMRCLLVDTGDRKILIDTGTGNKQADYLRFYGIKEIVDFETELNKLGLSCENITDVILTHLHFDHCGGCTRYNSNKQLELTFPKAYYWVGETQWKNMLNPNVREGDSYFLENMLPVQEAGRLKLVTENISLCPGIDLKIYNGHTVGQLVTYINTGDKTFVYVGDVIPSAANIPLAWVSAYDTFPITSMTEKKKLLDEAIEGNHILIFEHDAYTECCFITESNGKYKMGEAGNLYEML
ncbi:MAG: MBL fold metallo-hydrolase [Paludibacter sp.]|nr:MBL fold metallo-hydrolase [Paludibacter sp.]